MSEESRVSVALKRLADATDSLEKAVDIRLNREAYLLDAEAEVQRMAADRSRLAETLDETQNRANKLEHVNKEVSRRLVDAMETIRDVLSR